MQYKYPEILYALFLLIIPIIVHLFQLQRFIKVPFTNVQFLKQIKLQTRKSSQLKKWLILCTRLLAFTAIIFAFSQPYFSNTEKSTSHQTILYLDNSLSMEAKGNRGENLRIAAQEIIENFNFTENISLITNDNIFKNLDAKSLKNELLNVQYSSLKQDFKTILIKAEQLKSTQTNTSTSFILISDFQEVIKINKIDVTNVNLPISLVKLIPTKNQNISVDSIFIADKNNQEITLKVVIKNTNVNSENTSISLFNDTKLIGKTTTLLLENSPSEVEFKIPFQENINGKIVLEDENLLFDNSLYFTIIKPEKINIISIGKNAAFLSKIYTLNEFNFSQKNLNALDYNSIQEQNLVILNELENIPNALINILKTFVENGGEIVVIPSKTSNIASYNQLFNNLGLGVISNPEEKELKITTINYEHPLLKNVFEKQVDNFQYPAINQYYKSTLNNATAVVSIENQEVFISEIKSNKGAVYWFASPLNKGVTNFQNSPLIVPIFYNFGKYSFEVPQLYYTIGNENTIDIKTSINKDEVLKLKNETSEFIPLQQVFHNKVQLNTNEQPQQNGFYQIIRNDSALRTISFNYNRNESELKYTNLKELFKDVENVSVSNSIKETFIKLNEQQENKPLFKWFLASAIVFLLLEIAILKFFKV